MPVSVVVGGQYGSEGKGKVALALRRENRKIEFVVRPGGTNSGHTGYTRGNDRIVLRQFPAAALDGDVCVVFPAGSYIDVGIFQEEIRLLGLTRDQVLIDGRAHVISPEHRQWEMDAGLRSKIGSTGSGTGAAVLSRLARFSGHLPLGTPACEHPVLRTYVARVDEIMNQALHRDRGVLVEGTQGFGLSVLHGDAWPKATARDTTAAGFLSEAGIAPRWVEQVVLVLRSYPIRVAGDSGPLSGETTWKRIAAQAGSDCDLTEFTSVTNKVRRVGEFDPALVRRAILANGPTNIVLNHLDHVDAGVLGAEKLSQKALEFLINIEDALDQRVDWIGTGPLTLFNRHSHRQVDHGINQPH